MQRGRGGLSSATCMYPSWGQRGAEARACVPVGWESSCSVGGAREVGEAGPFVPCAHSRVGFPYAPRNAHTLHACLHTPTPNVSFFFFSCCQQVLVNCASGFLVAECDLEMRGAGEVLGKRQSGRDVRSSLKVLWRQPAPGGARGQWDNSTSMRPATVCRPACRCCSLRRLTPADAHCFRQLPPPPNIPSASPRPPPSQATESCWRRRGGQRRSCWRSSPTRGSGAGSCVRWWPTRRCCSWIP